MPAMNAVVPLRSTDDAKMISLIRRTVAADCSDDEFNLFVHTARHLRLDPLRRQIYAFVYSKNDPKKRRMSIITGIDGFRTIADRTGNYRPDEDEPRFEIDAETKDPTLNPIGLIKATVRVYKFAHGSWHPVTASAHWDEYAPIKDEWADDPETGRGRKTGRKVLDTSGNWGKMPRLMLAKVAEALALRKAWPDDLANVYAAEEMDRTAALDALPADLAVEGETQARLEKIGGHNAILISWTPDAALDPVPVGQLADRAMSFIRDNKDEPSSLLAWSYRNRHGLREFWARAGGDALEVKKVLEAAVAGAGS